MKSQAPAALIEKSAKALCRDDSRMSQFADQVWDHLSDQMRDRYYRQAMVVINVLIGAGWKGDQ